MHTRATEGLVQHCAYAIAGLALGMKSYFLISFTHVGQNAAGRDLACFALPSPPIPATAYALTLYAIVRPERNRQQK